MKILFTDECDSGLELSFFENITKLIVSKLDLKLDNECEVSLLMVGDEDIRSLNKEYRNKDKPTDVLSFPMQEEDILGDIVISLDTAKRQAEENEVTLKEEIAFLYIHGFLHLLGYDHELGETEEKEMFDIQEEILNIFRDTI